MVSHERALFVLSHSEKHGHRFNGYARTGDAVSAECTRLGCNMGLTIEPEGGAHGSALVFDCAGVPNA